MAQRIGRNDAAWKRVQREVLEASTVCGICGGDLDFAAAPRSRFAPSVDHVLPLSAMRGLDSETRRRMALDPANLRAAHYGCNSSRGAGRRSLTIRRSRVW